MGAFSRLLTCNHCLEIILEHQKCRDWRMTFEKCVPGRKQWVDQKPVNDDEDKNDSNPCVDGEAACEPGDTDRQATSSDPPAGLDAKASCSDEPTL